MTNDTIDAEPATATTLRGILMFILVVGLVGLIVELLLLGHYDGAWQITPLALMGIAMLALGWHAIARGRASLRAIQLVMGVFVFVGGIGLVLHYRGNVEFELEMNPALHGFALFREAVTGATPTLAPGAMTQLGLIGLAYCYRHPLLRRTA